MRFHDTHFHLDLFQEPRSVLQEIEHKGVYTIAVTNLPALFRNTLSLVANAKYVRPALGFHPELIASRISQISLFNDLISQTRYIGEVGLDNSRKTSSDYEQQKTVFEQIVQKCDDVGEKILTVHSRRAEKDVISIIGSSFNGKVILHWYSGSIRELERAVEYGFYFSVNESMLQSANGQKIISLIPNDRLLLETDGPYTKIGNIPCSPLTTEITALKVNRLRRDTYNGSIVDVDFQANFSALISL